MPRILLKSKQVPLEFQSNPKKFKKFFRIKYKSILPYQSVRCGGQAFATKCQHYFTLKQLLVILKLLKPELKTVNRTGRVALNLNFDTTLTCKPKDIRMGRGKGAPSEKVAVLRGGANVAQLYGISRMRAGLFSKLIISKLAIRSHSLNAHQ